MPMRCPHCGSVVEPGRDAAGKRVCPLCHNTGNVAPPAWTPAPAPAPPAWSAPPAPAGPPAATPGKAVAALILGVAGLVLFPLAVILGPVALVLGIQALRQLKRLPPGTPGQGLAIAGIVLGGIGIVVGITVLMAAVVFVLVSNLAMDDRWAFDVDPSGEGGVLTVTGYPGVPDWSEVELGGTASCRLPTGDVDYGDAIVCTTDGSVTLLDAATGAELYGTAV